MKISTNRKLILLGFFCVIFQYCSNIEDEPFTTFLSAHDGLVWIDQGSYSDEITYLKFIDDESQVAQVFNKFIPSGRDCFNRFYLSELWGDLEIVENSAYTLKIDLHPPDWELNKASYCFIRTGDNIELSLCIIDEYENTVQSTSTTLSLAQVNLNKIKICGQDNEN